MPKSAASVGIPDAMMSPSIGGADPLVRRLLGAIGRPEFYNEMLGCLGDMCGADHVHVFMFDGAKPHVVSELSRDGSRIAKQQTEDYLRHRLWLVDSDMQDGSRVDVGGPLLFQLDSEQHVPSELRDFYLRQQLRERLMLFNRESFGVLGLSMLRPSGSGVLGAADEQRLDFASGIVFPMLVKHVEAMTISQRMIRALTSLPLIEATLSRSPTALPARERQVGARLLYGLSASSIAVDLGISQETVVTHRKRLYARLAIACQRELMLWYLGLFSSSGAAMIGTPCLPD